MARTITIVRDFPKSAGETSVFARFVASRMTDNAYFPAPPVALSALLAAVQELEEAEAATQRGTHGLAAARNQKLQVVHGLLGRLATYVVSIARQHGVDAEAVLASSGFDQKRPGGQGKWAFTAAQGQRSDEVRLKTALAGRGASYNWQYSKDGVNWVDWRQTSKASTVISGLEPGTRYFLRVRSFFKDVLGDWSDPITFLPG
jgi:hypothetical protein